MSIHARCTCFVVVAFIVAAVAATERPRHGATPGFQFAAFSCNVSMPPLAPVLGVGLGASKLYYAAWHSRVFDATTLKLEANGTDVGVYLAAATPTTGYTVLETGGVLNPGGMNLYQVDLRTLSKRLVGPVGLPNTSSVESLTIPTAATGAGTAPIAYATVSLGFMLPASTLAEIDTSTGAVRRSVVVMKGINNSGQAGIMPPAMDMYRHAAYFWATPNSLLVVDLASMAVSTMKLAIDNSDVGMANGQAAGVVVLPTSRTLGYLTTLNYNQSKYAFVIVDMDDLSSARQFPVPLPAGAQVGQLLSTGVTASTGTSLDDSYFFFVLSSFEAATVYRVSGSGHIDMTPRLMGMMTAETPLTPGMDGSMYMLMMEMNTRNTSHTGHYCPGGFLLGRFGPTARLER